MPIFETISVWLKEVLLPYGGFGLMLLAVCDSSFVSLPEVNDILLMTFSISNPGGMVTYATLTTLGSLIGCALLYGVGRKGGEAFLRRTPRMTDDKLVRIQNWYRRHGVLAVIIPSLLPPIQASCISTKRTIPVDARPLAALTASRADLLHSLEDQSKRIHTLQGTIALDASSGGNVKTEVMTEYRQTKGFVLVERPNHV